MSTITTKDGAKIFYKDWGSGKPVVFSHGWPLNADAWDEQLYFLASNGYRAIAHDRRGHGRSSQTLSGNDMDTYADDLAALVKTLDLQGVIHIGHSTGGGEVARYIGRYGTARVAKAVLVDAVAPGLVKNGVPIAVFDQIRTGLKTDRSQYYQDFSVPFYGANRAGSKVSKGVLDAFWRLSMQACFPAAYECVKAFSESDFAEDLKRFDVPTLVIHGDDDQIVPIDVAGRLSAKMIKGATLKIYEDAPHGLMSTHQEQFNNDLLQFARQQPEVATTARATVRESPEARPTA